MEGGDRGILWELAGGTLVFWRLLLADAAESAHFGENI